MLVHARSPNPICYVEIPAPDPAAAAKFYNDVFGWSAEPSNLTDSGYWMFQTGEGQLLGGFNSEAPVNERGIIFYVNVESIEIALQRIEEHGGKVALAKEDIGGGYGYSAIFCDPSGNQIGLWCKN